MMPPAYWHLPHASQRQPVLGRGVVSTSQPLAAQAGLAALRAGGNAVDAALAAAITLTVVEPVSNGIGGDLFALIWQPGAAQRVWALNASGRAPMAWQADRLAGATAVPLTGWDSVTVPGAVHGWAQLSGRLGRLPFEALFAEAIRLADEGFVVSPVVADKWQREALRLGGEPDFAAQFLLDRCAPLAGSLFRPAHQADTLREIARSQGQSFYRGALAQAIVAHAQQGGAALSLEDLARQWEEPGWVTPERLAYRGHDIYQLPPNGQGITTLLALGILQHFQSARLSQGDARAQHLMVEALKLAFVDTYAAVADPACMRQTSAELLAPERLAALARRIRLDRAGDFGPAIPPWGGTVYVAACDADGCAVSLIQSNFYGSGSGVVVPGTGISLHNRAACFSLQPGHPNQLAGGKRPLHTIIPALVTRDDAAWGVLGVTGGPIQPQGQVQMLVAMLDGGANPQAAVDMPRWKLEHKSTGVQLDFEPQVPMRLQAALRRRGHAAGPPGITGGDFGGGFAVVRSPCAQHGESLWVGAADPRRDGQAVAS